MRYYLLLILLSSALLTGCGYRWGYDRISSDYTSISVPYVQGDEDGYLTSSIIRQLTYSGALDYVNCGGDLILNVCLDPLDEENIGFIFAPERNGNRSNIVVSNEARLTLVAKVTLIDRRSQQVIIGPLKIGAYLDFDFQPDLSNQNVHRFSLAQLEMYNLAQDTASPSLYDLLAEKIVDYVVHCW